MHLKDIQVFKFNKCKDDLTCFGSILHGMTLWAFIFITLIEKTGSHTVTGKN